jgi:hypothetical protein
MKINLSSWYLDVSYVKQIARYSTPRFTQKIVCKNLIFLGEDIYNPVLGGCRSGSQSCGKLWLKNM